MKTLIIVMVVLLVSSVMEAATLPATAPIPTPRPRPQIEELPPALQGMPPQYLALYRAVGVNALWVQDGAPSPLAAGLREALLSADRHGLKPSDYWTDELERQSAGLYSADDAIAFERAATVALVKYATEVSTGRVNPRDVDEEIKLTKRALSTDALAAALKNTTVSLPEALDLFAPQWPAYLRLKDAFARLKSLNENLDFPAVAIPKNGASLGKSVPALTNVKIRLRTLGYPVSETGPVYTQELLTHLKKYYADNTLPGEVTLRAGSLFWTHISVPLGSRLQQIQLSMEKIRWIPNQPDRRYFDVNMALQRLRIYEDGALVMEMRTINGRSKRKTPTLKDKVTVVELNPSWTVPARLIIEDKLPIVSRDPNWLEQNGYRILSANGRTEYSWWDVNWSRITRENVEQYIMLRQRPGLGNALGVMKFHLTNPYAIYLHDTNERHLFPENHRLLSSGCIRLERPVDVALYLLRDQARWNDRYAIESQLATSRFADAWTQTMRQIPVSQPVPVYLNYLTAEADEDGLVKFANDYYGQDTALYNLLRSR